MSRDSGLTLESTAGDFSAQLLAGKPVAEAIYREMENKVTELIKHGVQPGLGTILVGNDPASSGYVRKKHEACEELGIRSFHLEISAESSQKDLLAAIDEFNKDKNVHAYLIQHPVPNGFDFNEALVHIDPKKDADGLHPVNLGKLVLNEPAPRPCTPAGIATILNHYNIDLVGKHVVVIGRGPTLGRPLSILLSNKGYDAAVTVVHSRVGNLSSFTRDADILISAVGIGDTVTADMVKPGAVVISGGISWQGKKLIPDVSEDVAGVASWVTPRLGGVGPTTIAMLLVNTVAAAEATLN